MSEDAMTDRQIERLMEQMRDEGKGELSVNEKGELQMKLTPEGEEHARQLWRRILDMPDASIEELDAAIQAAGDQLFKRD